MIHLDRLRCYGRNVAVDYTLRAGVFRAMRRRCPVCARKGISRHSATVDQVCPTCGLDLERQVGSFIGGVGLNTVVSMGCLLLVIVIGFIVTEGRASILGILVPAIAVALFVPVLFYARSRLVWVALELRWWPLEPDEVKLPIT